MQVKKDNSLIGAVSLVAIFTAISRVLALFREIELSSLFGATNVSDAYLLAQSIPVTFFSVIAVGMATTYIPIFNRVKSERSDEAAELFTNNCANILFLITTILICVIELCPQVVLRLFASGLSDGTMKTAILFLRISAPSIYFIAYVNLYSSYLRIKGVFYATTIIGIPFNLCSMILYYLAYRYQIEWLAISILASNFLQFIVIIIYVLRTGHKFKFYCNLRDSYVKHMLVLAIPVIISTGFDEINVMIDKNLASSLMVAGGISILHYASILTSTCHSFISMSINTVIFPKISSDIASDDFSSARSVFHKAVHLIELFVVPIVVWIAFFAGIIITVIFGRGKFSDESVRLVATCLFFYGISLPVSGVRNIILDVYYSKNNTIIPMINGIIAVIANITFSLIFSRFLGICGLAIATSMATILSTCLLVFSLRRVDFKVPVRDFFGRGFMKILLGSLLSAVMVKILYTLICLITESPYWFIPVAILGILTYFILMIAFRDEEMIEIWKKIKKAIRRKS